MTLPRKPDCKGQQKVDPRVIYRAGKEQKAERCVGSSQRDQLCFRYSETLVDEATCQWGLRREDLQIEMERWIFLAEEEMGVRD